MVAHGRLENKVAIITGGAAGIGLGIVRAFVKEGAKVLFVDINAESGKCIEAELGVQARFLYADISKEESAKQIADAAVDVFGGIDILVNNAHASRQVSILETTKEHLDLSFGTGFYPALWLMQASYPQLKQREGSVINFGSGAALSGMPTQASYGAAKEAVRGISRVAANEWAPDNININVICPIAATEGVERWLEEFPEMRQPTLDKIPLHRLGDPERDIGRVAVFLASEDASFITGQTIMVDGGAIKMR